MHNAPPRSGRWGQKKGRRDSGTERQQTSLFPSFVHLRVASWKNLFSAHKSFHFACLRRFNSSSRASKLAPLVIHGAAGSPFR